MCEIKHFLVEWNKNIRKKYLEMDEFVEFVNILNKDAF